MNAKIKENLEKVPGFLWYILFVLGIFALTAGFECGKSYFNSRPNKSDKLYRHINADTNISYSDYCNVIDRIIRYDYNEYYNLFKKEYTAMQEEIDAKAELYGE